MNAKLCECGCGEPAPIAKQTSNARGYVAGRARRFIHGHHRRMTVGSSAPAWKGDAAGYSSLHGWLNVQYTKTGICERCLRHKKTDYAFRHMGDPYTRDRRDYMELCRSCHAKYDNFAKNFGTKLDKR